MVAGRGQTADDGIMIRRLVIGGALGLAACGPAGAAQEDPELMRVQREVWDVWFAGDTARLRELTPGLIAINDHSDTFGDQEGTIQGSARFHAAGGRLVDLSFSDMRVQRFGDVAVIYSKYRLLAVTGSDTLRMGGRASETFVRHQGRWVNPGWHLDAGQ